MAGSHELILVGGLLCLAAIFAGLVTSRIGTPLLLVFIAVGMLAGEDGPGGIRFDNFRQGYLVGSLALAAILFQGGLSTSRGMLKQALLPSIALATAGVAISAGVVGAAAVWLFQLSWPEALLIGAVTAPTDAAAVSVLLHMSRAPVPSRVVAALEVESGLNDPMSVFLTLALVQWLMAPQGLDARAAGLLFLEEMGGGIVIGLASGYALLALFRRLNADRPVLPILALGVAMTVFGGAQILGASGFLAVYLAGLVVGNHQHPAGEPVTRFFGTLGWLAQIVLFLMLGLLVTPHQLPPVALDALAIAAVLIVVARPLAVFACLLPFGWRIPEAAFVSWAGLRGAVPIYLTTVPLLEGFKAGRTMFDVVFVVVIASVALQGWTLAPVARLLGLEPDAVKH